MKLIISVILLIAANLSFAQQFKISGLPAAEAGSVSSIFHNGEMFSISREFKKGANNYGHSITIKKHNKDLAIAKSFQLSAGEKIYGPLTPFLKSVDNKLYLFHSKELEDDKIQLLVSEVNAQNLKLAEPLEIQNMQPDRKHLGYYHRSVSVVDEHQAIISNSYNPTTTYKTYFFEWSPDSSKALFIWTTGWDNEIFFSILNRNMTKIRGGNFKLSNEDRIALGSCCIDNSGSIYLVYYYSKKKQHMAELLTIGKTGTTDFKKITIPEAEVSSVFVHLMKEKNILFLTGTYKQNSDNLSGVFIQQFDPAASKAIKTEKTDFPKELVDILDDEGWASNKRNYGISEGWMVEPFILNDGTITLTGELRKTVEGQRASFKFSGSILTARFNHNGTVFIRIPKLRVSAGTTYGDSYRLVEFKNKMIFFYNDHLSNLELDIEKTPRRSDNYSNSVLAAAIVDEKGDVKRKIVIDLSKESYLGEIKSSKQLSLASYYIPFRRVKTLGGLTDDFKYFILNIE
jgi:hypothetical protein